MKLAPRCHGCLLSRVELECRLAGADGKTAQAIRAACAHLLADLAVDPDIPAPVIATRVHRLAYDLAGCVDPYHTVKATTTHTALETVRAIRGEIHSFSDYAIACIIGNAFDYGVEGHHIADDFPAISGSSLRRGFRSTILRLSRSSRRGSSTSAITAEKSFLTGCSLNS